MLRLFLAATALIAFAGCDSVSEPSDFTDTIFTLVDAELPPDAGITTLTPSTVTFERDGTLTIASCNTCEGSYRWRSNELVVVGLGCTEVGCGTNLDLGPWLLADRVVVSDVDDDDDLATLISERDGAIATFVFNVADR